MACRVRKNGWSSMRLGSGSGSGSGLRSGSQDLALVCGADQVVGSDVLPHLADGIVHCDRLVPNHHSEAARGAPLQPLVVVGILRDPGLQDRGRARQIVVVHGGIEMSCEKTIGEARGGRWHHTC